MEENKYIVSELVISEKGNMIIDYKPPYRKEKESEYNKILTNKKILGE